MTEKIKSGQEILDEFFSQIINIEGVNQDVAESVLKLYKEDKLTNINLSNELEKIREKKDNDSGKSLIADAFEWFYYDKIEHLSTEEIGSKGVYALRNVFLPDNEDAYVELSCSDSKCDCRKKLFYNKSKLTSEYLNTSQNFKDYLNASLKENLILRYKDLLRFILSTKAQKLEEISQIIGFSEVSKIKGVLKRAVNDLKKELKIKNYDNHISIKQSRIIEQIDQNIVDDEQYLRAVRELVTPLNLSIKVVDNSSIDTILELLKKPEDKEAIAQQLSYEKVIENLNNF